MDKLINALYEKYSNKIISKNNNNPCLTVISHGIDPPQIVLLRSGKFKSGNPNFLNRGCIRDSNVFLNNVANTANAIAKSSMSKKTVTIATHGTM